MPMRLVFIESVGFFAVSALTSEPSRVKATPEKALACSKPRPVFDITMAMALNIFRQHNANILAIRVLRE